MMKKKLYVDMDGVLVDFETGIQKLTEDQKSIFDGRYDEVPGIFSLMDPIEGAIDAYHTLSTHFDTYILSTAPWENPSAWQDKIMWVQKHLNELAHKRLILTHHKNLNMGDYLIDDRKANGSDKFTGEHIHFGTNRFPNWQSVLEYLL